MLKCKWTTTTITTNQQANDMVALFKELKPSIGAFDTETTGLHIKKDKPFFYQFGFVDLKSMCGYTFAVDLEKQPILSRCVILAWLDLAKQLQIFLGHNICYDLHMLLNMDIEYTYPNVSDTMFYIRYGHDAIAPKDGGVNLKLKDYASRYIDPHAKQHERLLDVEKSTIAKELNIKLRQKLKMTAKKFAEISKDALFEIDDLSTELKAAYVDWLNNDIPLYLRNSITNGIIDKEKIPYNILNRKNLATYAHYDIIYTIEIYLFLEPVVTYRKNLPIITEIENKLIYVLLDMERVGFKVDKEYLENCRAVLKKYIQERRLVLHECAEQAIRTGQHPLIKKILSEKYEIDMDSTCNDKLDELLEALKAEQPNAEVITFIEVLQELRTLEKWYSTYIVRFLGDIYDGRIYTQINQVGTISGRVTSGFQQFPKDPIIDVHGNILFHPRKIVLSNEDPYDKTVWLDWSQIELRIQAMYTILVGHPDLNLCRAYMPYECWTHSMHTASIKVPFDYTNPEHLRDYEQHTWYRNEDDTVWEPTDVHGATTKEAFGIDESHPDFKKLRYIGKRLNFAKLTVDKTI